MICWIHFRGFLLRDDNSAPAFQPFFYNIDMESLKIQFIDLIINSTILKPSYLKFDIDSAPYKIGDKVKVLNNPNMDETFDRRFLNNICEVIYFEYDCGCGQTFPEDPMIGIKSGDGKIGEFWKEELELIS